MRQKLSQQTIYNLCKKLFHLLSLPTYPNSMNQWDPDGPSSAEDGIYGTGCSLEDARVVLVPAPFEATVSYGAGTAQGPEVILQASAQLDLFDVETGEPYQAGIHMCPVPDDIKEHSEKARMEALKVIEAGAAADQDPAARRAQKQVNEVSQQILEQLKGACTALLHQNKIVGLIGGDHSTAYANILAHAEHYGDFGLLQIDAHADLRVAYEGFINSHASVMNRVLEDSPQLKKLCQVAIRDLSPKEYQRTQEDPRIHAYFDAHISRDRLENKLIAGFKKLIQQLPQKVYVSVDIDGLDPSYCPGTGTPVPGGISFGELSILLGEIVSAGKTIIGFDLCEVAPSKDSEWDANVGARVLYKLIGWCLKSRDNADE